MVDDLSSLPVIVGGCYRSGTSLVRRLLDAHPRIHCGPEVKLFRDFYGDYLGIEDTIAHLRFIATARSLLPAEEVLDVLGAALVEMHERAARGVGKPRWADKAPENVVFLDEWQRILGGRWIFLHVARGPLDTLASIAEAEFPRSIPAGLEERVDLYLEYNSAGLAFAQRSPERYVRVLYEDLVSAPEATLGALMTSLGETLDPEQLAIDPSRHQPGLEDPKVASASAIHGDSVGRWRRELSEDDAELIARRAAAVWSRLDSGGRYSIPQPVLPGGPPSSPGDPSSDDPNPPHRVSRMVVDGPAGDAVAHRDDTGTRVRPLRLLTVGSLPPEWGGPVRGGAATFHAALLSALLERRGEVEVVGVLPPTPLERQIPLPAWVRPEGVDRARFYEQVLEDAQPDVVLMNHIAHTIGVAHARLGSPAPAVGVIQSWHNVTFRSGAERRRAWEMTQEALSGLAAMVAVSAHTLDEGARLGFRYPTSARVVHNPVPPLYMADDVEPGRRDRAGVIFLGSLIPRKEPGALVEAAGSIPGLPVLLAGEGELRGELRERISALGVGARVRLAEPPQGDGHLGWVRNELLSNELMCLPSRSEGLPLAFVEALACGTPVVGFGPAVREVGAEVGLDVGEPLDSGAPEKIAAAIERVRAADWDRDRLRRATLDAFGLDRVVDAYVQLLTRAARRSRSA